MSRKVLWILVLCLGLIGCNAGDLNFSIPKEKPPLYSAEYIPDAWGTVYHIIYNEDFSGRAEYYPEHEKVLFVFQNLRKNPFWLKNPRYQVQFVNSEESYALIQDDKQNCCQPYAVYTSQEIPDFLNHGETVVIQASIPSEVAYGKEIKGFNIWYGDTSIRFGYHHELGWRDKARWWIAEKIR